MAKYKFNSWFSATSAVPLAPLNFYVAFADAAGWWGPRADVSAGPLSPKNVLHSAAWTLTHKPLAFVVNTVSCLFLSVVSAVVTAVWIPICAVHDTYSLLRSTCCCGDDGKDQYPILTDSGSLPTHKKSAKRAHSHKTSEPLPASRPANGGAYFERSKYQVVEGSFSEKPVSNPAKRRM